MNKVDLLILNGPPGSGKSTLMESISDQLRSRNIACAVIDVDEIARVHLQTKKPIEWKKDFMWKNLMTIWPNYVALGDIKIIIPIAIDNDKDFEALKTATSNSKITICELKAPSNILKKRVTRREPNDNTRERLFWFIDRYENRMKNATKKFSDFEVSTNNADIDETAGFIITKLGWL